MTGLPHSKDCAQTGNALGVGFDYTNTANDTSLFNNFVRRNENYQFPLSITNGECFARETKQIKKLILI